MNKKPVKFRLLSTFLGILLLPAGGLHAQGSNCWGNFRGDAKLTGVSNARLPGQPVLLWNFNTRGGHQGSTGGL